MSIPVHTRLVNLKGIYPGLRAIRSNPSIRREDVRTHLVGDGDLLVDRESGVLLQVSRVPHRSGDVHARILEPHPQRVHQSEAFIDELGVWLTKHSAPSRTNAGMER
ncbi:MAG: hypothetical protein OXG94_12335 [Bacteroidetes bacterium]|nr:hypothetical protein [Bacteroidota bacterium]